MLAKSLEILKTKTCLSRPRPRLYFLTLRCLETKTLLNY